MNNPPALSAGLERCPYLGLHDDRLTALAYPSAWNYCYHAVPAASVLETHQVEACLSLQYVHCPVYLSRKPASLPARLRSLAGVRSRNDGLSKMGRLTLFLLLGALVVLVIFLGQRFLSVPEENTTLSLITTSPGLAAHPTPSPVAAGLGEAVPLASAIAVNLPTKSLMLSPAPSRAASRTLTLTPIPEGTCGHALDIPFGRNVQFVIHRVVRGENLTLYAKQYHTSTDAILAVNHHLPLPVWEDWIIVIPVEATDVSGIPPFEPYQVIGTIVSIGKLAQELGTDSRSLSTYNAFEATCRAFSGWLLIPRKTAAP
jgi:hypothetical protein